MLAEWLAALYWFLSLDQFSWGDDMLRWTALILMMALAACAESGTGNSSDPTDASDPTTTEADPADAESDASDVADASDSSEPEIEPGCDVDGDSFASEACGGDDCDDTDASIRPNQFESCDFIDNNCDGDINEGLNCTVYAHNATELFSVDPFKGSIGYIGAVPGVVDFDTDTDGNLYGISATLLYRLNEPTGDWIEVGTLGETDGQANGFAIDAQGNAFATSGAWLYSIDLETGEAQGVGMVGEDIWSSGDCVVNKSNTLFMTSSDSSTPGDDLVLVDATTGVGSIVGNLGVGQIYGLTAAWGYMFGFTADGRVVQINESEATATQLHHFTDRVFYGAASSPTR